MKNIGFIGLGNMGGPMAANLIKAGHTVKGFDIAENKIKQFEINGGHAVTNVNEASRDIDILITMLPAGKHVRNVYLGEEGILASQNSKPLLIDCSTIDVGTAREVAAKAKTSALFMLDAPVSGGVIGAEAGTLTIMVGGDVIAFTKAQSIFENMGKNIIHAGGSGNGQVAKICNNMILGISMVGVSEAFVLAEKLGLDHQKLFDISSTASGQCWSMTSYCPVPGPVPTSPANNEYKAGFTGDMMLKDLRLSQEAATSCRAATPLGAKATELYTLLEEAGQNDKDFSSIINLIRQRLI